MSAVRGRDTDGNCGRLQRRIRRKDSGEGGVGMKARPPNKPASERATEPIQLRVTKARKLAWVNAAAAAGKTVSRLITESVDAATKYRGEK